VKTIINSSGHYNKQHARLPDSWRQLPFMLAKGQTTKMNIQRIIEALLISGLTAGIVLWGTVQVMKSEMKALEQKVDNVDQRVTKIYDDIYKPAFKR